MYRKKANEIKFNLFLYIIILNEIINLKKLKYNKFTSKQVLNNSHNYSYNNTCYIMYYKKYIFCK